MNNAHTKMKTNAVWRNDQQTLSIKSKKNTLIIYFYTQNPLVLITNLIGLTSISLPEPMYSFAFFDVDVWFIVIAIWIQ